MGDTQLKKLISIALAMLMVSNQFPTAGWTDAGTQDVQLDPLAGYQSVQTLDDVKNQNNRPDYRPLVSEEDKADQRSLENVLALSAAEARQLDEYSFEDALAQLSPDYAVAVVVSHITAEDLERLTKLDYEVGVAVVHGKIVLFTSGSSDEIRMIPAAQDLLSQASILTHTHPEGQRAEPSLTDFEEAGSKTEYAITTNGVYAYNHDGLVYSQPLSYQDLISLIDVAHAPGASSKEARDVLHAFIAAVDEYNQNREAADVFRSADPPTVFPRTPNVGVFSGGAGNTDPALSLTSNQSFRIDYNVTPAGSYDGTFMSFDDYSTAGVTESVNLSALTQIVFNVASNNLGCINNKCFKIEFKDADGLVAVLHVNHYGEVKITGDISNPSTPLGYLFSNIDMTRVKEIVFVVETANTNPDIGYMEVTIGNLTLPYVPVVPGTTYNQAAISILPGNPVVSSGHGTTGVGADDDSTITTSQISTAKFNVNSNNPDAGDFTFSQISWGYFDGQNAFIGTGGNVGNNVTLALNGTDRKSVV